MVPIDTKTDTNGTSGLFVERFLGSLELSASFELTDIRIVVTEEDADRLRL